MSGGTFTDGEVYERLMGRWSRMVGDTFIDWLKAPPGLRWIDVGCGNGAFTETLIGLCAPAEVIGVDPSEEQLAYARRRPGAAMAQFRAGDALALPFEKARFDAAAMALVIAFVPDPLKAVTEMTRVVRPGGWVATYMWDLPGGGVPVEPLHTAMRGMGIERPLPPGSAASNRDALKDLWDKAGLRGVDTREIRIKVSFDDFDDFWASNAGPVGPHGKLISTMPADKLAELRTRTRDLLKPGPDGRIVYEAFANAVKGQVPG